MVEGISGLNTNERKIKMEIMLTAIIVTYNHESYITECIDSIVKQKCDFPVEVIVADDCSTDNTIRIVKEKYGNNIRISKTTSNCGLCQNLYLAYMEAKGKYIFTCAGDDYLPSEEVFCKHIAFLENNSDFFSVSNWIQFVDVVNNRKVDLPVEYEEYSMLDFLRGVPTRFYLGTMRNSFRNDNVNYLCQAAKNNEEIQMTYYCLTKGKKKIIPEVLYSYCYKASNGNSNYCSNYGFAQILIDTMMGFYAVEKVNNKKYNFSFAKFVYFDKYFNKILDSNRKREVFRLFSYITFKDMLTFIKFKFILKFHAHKFPERMLAPKKLILR